MNQKATKKLKKSMLLTYPEGDPRNKTDWRKLKKAYNSIPRNRRHKFIENMYMLKKIAENSKAAE